MGPHSPAGPAQVHLVELTELNELYTKGRDGGGTEQQEGFSETINEDICGAGLMGIDCYGGKQCSME